jgi:hypothetical protein
MPVSEMAPRFIVGVVAIASVAICGILATFFNFEMIDRVNEKLPDTAKFELIGWHFSKREKLYGQYRTFYPDGRLIFRVRILTAIMFVCLLVAAWSFGFLSR